jgi:uncharacterized membrane protein
MSFLPTPLHPAVVHFPIVFAVLAPIFALVALVAIRRGSRPVVAWGFTTLLVAGLVGSSWAALETGEQQEDRVEPVVAEAAFETHEEAADAFFGASIAVLAISLIGFAPRQAGTAARALATAGTLVLVVMGYRVGHSGGQLVYQEGAASAYVAATRPSDATGGAGAESTGTAASRGRGDDDR